jgi:hypothetical protein
MDELHTMDTSMIRSRATGPEPCNTLAFIRCRVPGIDVPTNNGKLERRTMKFLTEFRIDGYVQSEHLWYVENTHVSATASLRYINTTTDMHFCVAVDKVTPELQKTDGRLAFLVDLAAYMQVDSWPSGYNEIAFIASLTAYVLCFEPRVELPPSGSQRSTWAHVIDDEPRISEVMTQRAKLIAAHEARRKPENC